MRPKCKGRAKDTLTRNPFQLNTVTMALWPWATFVREWEKRFGDPKRSGREVPNHELAWMRKAYRQWQGDAKNVKVSAGEWLEARRKRIEALGFRGPIRPGETRVTSDWLYDVRA